MVKKKSVGNDWKKTPEIVKSYVIVICVLTIGVLLISSWLSFPKQGSIVGKSVSDNVDCILICNWLSIEALKTLVPGIMVDYSDSAIVITPEDFSVGFYVETDYMGFMGGDMPNYFYTGIIVTNW